MKIQLVGYYYSRNLGDAVLCDCVSLLLSRDFPDAEVRILDLSGRTEFQAGSVVPYSEKRLRKWQRKTKTLEWVSSHTPWDEEYQHEKREFCQVRGLLADEIWREADCCVFAGGQIMTDWLTLPVVMVAEAFLSQEKNVYFLSAGTGPVSSPRLRRIYEKVFRNPHVRLITMRDHVETFNSYYEIPQDRCAFLTADAGLWADQVYGDSSGWRNRAFQSDPETAPEAGLSEVGALSEAAEEDKRLIGVGFYYPSMLPADRTVRFLQGLIGCLETNRIPWEAFTNGSGYDAGFGEYVLSTMPGMLEQHRAELEDIPQRPEDLVARIGSYRGILSFRLHSHVIAASLGVPSVAFVWDDKLNGLFRMMGCPERALSLDTKADEVLRIFGDAMQKGWDRSLVEEKREETARVLRNALERDYGKAE